MIKGVKSWISQGKYFTPCTISPDPMSILNIKVYNMNCLDHRICSSLFNSIISLSGSFVSGCIEGSADRF